MWGINNQFLNFPITITTTLKPSLVSAYTPLLGSMIRVSVRTFNRGSHSTSVGLEWGIRGCGVSDSSSSRILSSDALFRYVGFVHMWRPLVWPRTKHHASELPPVPCSVLPQRVSLLLGEIAEYTGYERWE